MERMPAALCAGAILACAVAGSASANDTYWQGAYAGLAVGGAYSAAGPNTATIPSGYFDSVDAAQVNPILQRDVGGWDATGAALLGYDHRIGNIVVGIEADVTAMGFSETRRHGSTAYNSFPTSAFETETSVSADFLASLRPKLGYASGNYLFYMSAGPSLARIKTTLRFSDNHPLVPGGPTDDTRTKTAIGVSTGLGVGYRFGDGWAVRGDYVLTYFPDAIDGSAEFKGAGGDDFKRDGDFQSHNLRFALIKYF